MESTRRYFQFVKSFLSWASFFLLLAFAWEYWRRGGPFRNLLWDENIMSSLVESLGWSWSEWVTSLQAEHWIKSASQVVSLVFLLGAIFSIIHLRQPKKVFKWGILLSTFFLFFQAFLNVKGHFWQLGQMMELTLQWLSPIFFIIAVKDQVNLLWLDWMMRIAIAITFIGHALYAIGFHPVPGHFLSMMMDGFGMEDTSAKASLFMIGWLDIIAALSLFVPNEKVKKSALIYIILWGFLTAIARVWSYTSFYTLGGLLDQWLAQSMLRWVHFLVPLSLWYLEKSKQVKSISV